MKPMLMIASLLLAGASAACTTLEVSQSSEGSGGEQYSGPDVLEQLAQNSQGA